MRPYPSIPGPNKIKELPCIAFNKLDGSNLRYEWNPKRGFYKFGSRRQLLDKNDPVFGSGWNLFLERYGDALAQTLVDSKLYPKMKGFTAYCEFFGENSFAGMHVDGEPKQVVLLDVQVHNHGMMIPLDFLQVFESFVLPEVVYEGVFDAKFVADVRSGVYDVAEGVVAKGVDPGVKGKAVHGLWMSKIKTVRWIREVKARLEENTSLRQILADNEREQKHVDSSLGLGEREIEPETS